MYYTECTQMLQIKYRVHNMTINYLRSIIIIKKMLHILGKICQKTFPKYYDKIHHCLQLNRACVTNSSNS